MPRAGGAPAAEPAPPAFAERRAPARWQAIDLVSDLHLSAAMPRTFDAFAAHLRHTPADAVWILGDLFELWAGDDAIDAGPFERRCVEEIAQAARRVEVGFMHGNRDFLVGDAWLRATGAVLLPDPTLLDAWGARYVLTHGDALCLADTDYQAFRAQVRSPAWQREVLARPLAGRLQLAAEIRSASDARRRFDGDTAADVDAGAARGWLAAAGAAQMIHGHTHRPADHALGGALQRHVLTDWDCDGPAPPRAEVLRITRAGIERVAPATPPR